MIKTQQLPFSKKKDDKHSLKNRRMEHLTGLPGMNSSSDMVKLLILIMKPISFFGVAGKLQSTTQENKHNMYNR